MSHPALPYSHRHHQDPLPDAPALVVERLSVVYLGTKRLALRDVSLIVPIWARVALVANSAGKSTLLKAVAKLLPIRSGELLIYGNPPGACHHRVAYLPQRGEIDWRFPVTLRRLVLTGRYVHLGWFKRPSQQDRAIADTVIDQLGLSDLADRQIGQLSGGQQQRAVLARLGEQGKTVIAATHDLGRLETDFDGALYLANGREVAPPPGAFTGMRVGV